MPETTNTNGTTTGAQGDPGAGGQGQQQQAPPPQTYEEWVAKQPKEVVELIDRNIAGLKTALGTERETRGNLEKTLRDASKKLEQGSEAKIALDKTINDLSERDTMLGFYDEAHRAGVSNLKLAYLAAKEGGFIDQKGRVNLNGLKEANPELFMSRQGPPGNAGSGTGNPPSGAKTMNDIIRQASGRQSN